MNIRTEEAGLLLDALGTTDIDAEKLVVRLESIGGLRALSWTSINVLDDIFSKNEIVRLSHIFSLANRFLCSTQLGELIDDAAGVAAFFRPRLALRPQETFWVLFLDSRGHPLGFECVAEGTLTACLIHPREVFGAAIRARAAQIVLVHNHPSGDPSPSEDDLKLTERMTEVGIILGIPVVDHVVVASGGYQSITSTEFMPYLE